MNNLSNQHSAPSGKRENQQLSNQPSNNIFPRPLPPNPPSSILINSSQLPPPKQLHLHNLCPLQYLSGSSQFGVPPPASAAVHSKNILPNNILLPLNPFNSFSDKFIPVKPIPRDGPIFSGHLIKPDKCDWAHEIHFDKPYIVEGIHIVPNKIPVQNLMLEGKTIPDISMRSFKMSVFSRLCNTKSDQLVKPKHVTSVTITGGVEWLPFRIVESNDDTANSQPVDYLSFVGDFDSLSIILHGHEFKPGEEYRKLDPPHPTYFDELSQPLTHLVGSSDVENNFPSVSGELFELSDVQPMEETSFFDKLNQPLQEMTDGTLSSYVEDRLLKWSGGLHLPEDVQEELSLLQPNLRSGLDSDVESLNANVKALVKILSAASKNVLPSKGDDTVSELANIIAGLLNVLRIEFMLPLSHERGSAEEGGFDERSSLCSDVLACCKAILHFKELAFEFYVTGGFSLLSLLMQQQPQLPEYLLADVVNCVLIGSIHFEIGMKLVEPVDETSSEESYDSQLSTYQTVLLVLAGLRPASNIIDPCKQFLSWGAFLESSRALQECCVNALEKATIIAEAISWRHSSNNSSSLNAEENQDTEDENENRILHTACECISSIYSVIKSTTSEFVTNLKLASKIGVRESGHDDDEPTEKIAKDPAVDRSVLDAAVSATLSATKIVASLVSLLSISKVVEDFAAIADWSAPAAADIIFIAADFKSLIVSLILELYGIPNIELVFANSAEELQLIQNLTSSHNFEERHLKALYSYYECVDSIYFDVEGLPLLKDQSQAVAYDAIGDNFVLSVCAITFAERSFGVFSKGDAADAPPINDSSLVVIAEDLAFLSMLMMYHVGRHVVHRVICGYFLPPIVVILETMSSSDDETSGRIFGTVFNILESAISHTFDPIVLSSLRRMADSLLVVLMNIDQVEYVSRAEDLCILLTQIQGSNEALVSTISELQVNLVADIEDLVDDESEGKAVSIVRKFQTISSSWELIKGHINTGDVLRAAIKLNNSVNASLLEPRLRIDESFITSSLMYATHWSTADRSVEDFVKTFHFLLPVQYSYLKMIAIFCSARGNIVVSKSMSEDVLSSVLDTYIVLYNLCQYVDNRSVLQQSKAECALIISRLVANSDDNAVMLHYILQRVYLVPLALEPIISLFTILIAPSDTASITVILESVNQPKNTNSNFAGEYFTIDSEKDSSSDVQCDRLLKCLVDRNFSIESLIMSSIYSSSDSCNAWGLDLAHRFINARVESSFSFCTYLASVLHRYMLQLLCSSSASDSDEEDVMLIYRMLIFIEVLCLEDTCCLALCNCGVLTPIFHGLRAKKDGIILVSLQCATTIHKTLTRIVSQLPEQGSLDMATYISHLIESMARVVVTLLPVILKEFKELPSPNLIEQCVICLQILHPHHVKSFLDRLALVGEGLSFEFISVKLWLAFEDSFQSLYEASDVCKLVNAAAVKGDSIPAHLTAEDISKILSDSHANFMCAANALKAICGLVILAYTENWIPLSTLAKAMRSSLADPKKVVIRFQRVYTMWATSGVLNTHTSPNQNRSRGESSTRVMERFHGDVRDFRGKRTFESRHALSSTALRALVDDLTKMSRFMLAKEERYGNDGTVVCGPDSDIYLDFSAPYKSFGVSEDAILRKWYDSRDLNHRLCQLSQAFGLDSIHSDLRRSIVSSDTSACYNLYHTADLAQALLSKDVARAKIFGIEDNKFGDLSLVESPTAGKKRKNRFSKATEDSLAGGQSLPANSAGESDVSNPSASIATSELHVHQNAAPIPNVSNMGMMYASAMNQTGSNGNLILQNGLPFPPFMANNAIAPGMMMRPPFPGPNNMLNSGGRHNATNFKRKF